MTWTIDRANTKLEFAVKHMMISTVRGTFPGFDADLDINADALNQSQVSARIETASVNTKDRTRDDYLVSPEFFNPQKYPHILFESAGVRLSGRKIAVSGKLKIRDIERSITLEGSVKGPKSSFGGGPRKMQFELSTDIDREAFGLTFNSAVETVSVVVGKKVTLKVHVALIEG